MKLTASIIICTRNRCDDLLKCLRSIASQTIKPEQLIIVDSSTIPLYKQKPFTHLLQKKNLSKENSIYFHTKPGLTYQRNQGIKRASGDIIYFFDDDVVLSPSYLFEMQSTFQQHPEYAGGMGDISNVNKNSSWQYSWFRRFFMLPHEQGSGRFTFSGMPTHPYGTSEFKTVETIGGCGMAFRKSILKQWQFDETLHGYCYLEDADIAYRISRHKKLFFNPSAQLKHNESPRARNKKTITYAMFAYNYSYLFFKNIYPHNRLKIVAYWWSLIGLLIQSIILIDKAQLRGYVDGLIAFYRKRKIV